jgi:hypothetical protein
MDKRNAIAHVEIGRERAIEPELAEAVRQVVDAESKNTRRAYATQFAKFEAWCKRRRTAALPAVVATYLIDLANTGADPRKPRQRVPRSQPSAWHSRRSRLRTVPQASSSIPRRV